MKILRVVSLYSILLFLPLSCFSSFLVYIFAADGCTGTESAAFSQMAICRNVGLLYPVIFLCTVLPVVLWVHAGGLKVKYMFLARLLLLIVMFGLPLLWIAILSNWQVVFTPLNG